MDTKPNAEAVAKVAQDLRLAQERYDSAAQEASAARRSETDALNALNEAQKAFDSAVQAVREAAPRGSGWAERGRSTTQIAAGFQSLRAAAQAA